MRASINFARRYAARTLVILLAVLLMTACSSAAAAAREAPTIAAAAPIPQQPAAPPAETQTTAPTAVCTSPATLTIAVTEGPYFKANSPERASLIEPGMAGTHLTLSGYVLTSDCKPVAHALIDFWQANADGVYDNSGYILRGHQFTDENGYYQLVTIDPGLYPGRTEHIHVKVQAPGGPVLTTQMFFPGVAENQTDQIYDPSLLINITQESDNSRQATFNFIVGLQ